MASRFQQGQAMVLALALTAAMVAGVLLVLDSGQAVNEKVRLTNAADAAAYSAAVWEARSLNFQSYMNRAMVANEVAIAQFVTLRSWSRYMDQNLRDISVLTSWVPGVREAMRVLDRVWSGLDRVVQRTLPGAEAAISHWNVDALAFAQVLAQQQAPITAGEIAADVVRANRPDARLTTASRVFAVRNANGWLNDLTTQYRHGDGELARLKAVVMDSRDGFTAQRTWTPLSTPIVSVRKRGGTDLIGEYSWRAMDTMAVHLDLGFTSQEVPIAWSGAENRRHVELARGTHGGSWRVNPRASRLAQRTTLPSAGYLGLPEFRDVVRPTQQRDLRLQYVVEVQEDGDAVATVDRTSGARVALLDGRELDERPNWHSGRLYALAAGEVFFRRPLERTDRRREYPSLFNPYWQARLAPVSRSDRALAALAKGLAVDPYAVLP